MSEAPRGLGPFGNKSVVLTILWVAAGACLLAWYFVRYIIPDWRLNHVFVETMCEILDKSFEEIPGGVDGELHYRSKFLIRFFIPEAPKSIETWAAYRATLQPSA